MFEYLKKRLTERVEFLAKNKMREVAEEKILKVLNSTVCDIHGTKAYNIELRKDEVYYESCCQELRVKITSALPKKP